MPERATWRWLMATAWVFDRERREPSNAIPSGRQSRNKQIGFINWHFKLTTPSSVLWTYRENRITETTTPINYVPFLGKIYFEINADSINLSPIVIENVYEPPKEETPPSPPSPPSTPTTPSSPGTISTTRGPRGPLVKTGDIRIWIYFAIGLLMIVAGFIIIRNQDKKQELA